MRRGTQEKEGISEMGRENIEQQVSSRVDGTSLAHCAVVNDR